MAQALLEDSVLEIAAVAADLALQGDRGMIKLCLTKALALPSDPTVNLDIGPLDSPKACGEAIERVIGAAASGAIALGKAKKLIDLIRLRLLAFHIPGQSGRFNADGTIGPFCTVSDTPLEPSQYLQDLQSVPLEDIEEEKRKWCELVENIRMCDGGRKEGR